MNNLLRKIVVILASIAACFSLKANGLTFEQLRESDPQIGEIPGTLQTRAFNDWKNGLSPSDQMDIELIQENYPYMSIDEKKFFIDNLIEHFPELEDSLIFNTPDPSWKSL